MAYLHNDRDLFTDAVNLAAEHFKILPAVAEKDYYVTMVLQLLAERLPFVVFKGGTSLSKCHKAIRRFSEDIDITIDTKLTQGQMGRLKNTIVGIAEELALQIPNIDETRSRRSYNKYILAYDSILEIRNEAVPSTIIMETSFAEISFPTVVLPVHSYIGDMMETEAPEVRKAFLLDPFNMKVQGLDRTLIDKVFAICDYYIKGDVRRHSRHIYDIHKLLPLVPQTLDFKRLVSDVRLVRAANAKLCPSAQPDVNVPALLMRIINDGIYKSDYEMITVKILEEQVTYDTAIDSLKKIAASDLF